MAASANPPAGNNSGQEATGNGNGATTNSLSVPENSVVGPTQAALRHNPGLSVDWTPDEQSLLEELLAKYATESNISRYAKIAMQLKEKTVRDVALRCRWMSKKEIGKRRKDDHSSRKNKDKKEKVTDSMPKSSHVANRANGPPYAQSVMSMDCDDGITYKAIGGPTGQLLEQNAQALDQISANFAIFKIQENINLFTQARNNILTILNDLNDMPEIMKQMPPLPVKLNDELASLILPARPPLQHDPNEHSMAEFLDHFQHTSSLPRGNPKMLQKKRQGSWLLRKKNLLLLGDRNMSNSDQPEELESDPSSDEDKVPQILKSAIPQRTMADQFHLALGAVSTNERLSIARPKQFGLSRRLQHVMQCEKDRDTYFLEKSQAHDVSSGAESSIDVRILSSSLEAKLTVCFCALHGDEKGSESLSNPQEMKSTGRRKLTIIFSSRICKDVELDVGNVIRIHQPWKEVHVNDKDEAIILCAYFSQI